MVLQVSFGAPYVFQLFADLDEAGQALDETARFLKRHVTGVSCR